MEERIDGTFLRHRIEDDKVGSYDLMQPIRERLEVLVKEELESLPVIEAKARDATKNAKGGFTKSLSTSRRFIGVARYALEGEAQALISGLKNSGKLELELVRRFEKGDPISASYVSMILYQSLFSVLASGDLTLSKEFASAMGGRDAIERKHDNPFTYAMGYTLKYFVLLDTKEMKVWSKKLSDLCAQKDNKDFIGYADAFEAILQKDSKALNKAFEKLLQGHRNQSKGNGLFAVSEDELLCVWGVGLANLAVYHGLEVLVKDPLFPRDLVRGLE